MFEPRTRPGASRSSTGAGRAASPSLQPFSIPHELAPGRVDPDTGAGRAASPSLQPFSIPRELAQARVDPSTGGGGLSFAAAFQTSLRSLRALSPPSDV